MIAVALISFSWTNETANVTLQTGYYQIQMIGAKGGSISNITGGNPAKFQGILKVENTAKVYAIAGSYPDHGTLGEGGSKHSIYAAAGGGYSAIYLNDDLYAMVGGGGGATFDGGYIPGLPAGGEGYVYNKTNETIPKSGTSNNHKGGDGLCNRYLGIGPACSGGGGGYFGGDAGTEFHSQGQGGSSYAKPNAFVKYNITDGNQSFSNETFGEILDGKIIIMELNICNANCTMCDYDKPTSCTKCKAGKNLFTTDGKHYSCVEKCSDLLSSSFRDTDGVCKQCAAGCSNCTSGSVCLECKSGYQLNGTECKLIKTQNPTTSNGNTSIGQLLGNNTNSQDKDFKWWIIVAVVVGVALVVVVIVFVIYKKKGTEQSIEMMEENVEDAKPNASTVVTVNNPLYSRSTDAEEDPFKRDFEEEATESAVFHNHTPDVGAPDEIEKNN